MLICTYTWNNRQELDDDFVLQAIGEAEDAEESRGGFDYDAHIAKLLADSEERVGIAGADDEEDFDGGEEDYEDEGEDEDDEGTQQHQHLERRSRQAGADLRNFEAVSS